MNWNDRVSQIVRKPLEKALTSKATKTVECADMNTLITVSYYYYIRTVINFSASGKIEVMAYRRSSILIGHTIFPTSEYNRLTNQRPHAIVRH